MSETISWLAGGATAVAVAALLVGFTAWLRFLDTDHAGHGLKPRCHHKENGR
jgi:hypothetical protein